MAKLLRVAHGPSYGYRGSALYAKGVWCGSRLNFRELIYWMNGTCLSVYSQLFWNATANAPHLKKKMVCQAISSTFLLVWKHSVDYIVDRVHALLKPLMKQAPVGEACLWYKSMLCHASKHLPPQK